MRQTILCLLAFALGSGLTLHAGDLPLPLQARFVDLLAKGSGSAGKVATKDAGMAGELGKLGVKIEDGAKIGWASSEAEVKALKAAGKLVLCPKKEWVPSGAGVVITEEGGKPQLYLHMGNVTAAGVTLQDGILKIGIKL